MPCSIEAERAILGAVLLDNSYLQAATEKLTPGDFFHDHHRRIFSAMIALRDSEKAIDLVTVGEFLQVHNELEAVGGVAYVSQLMDGVPRIVNVVHYAAIVKEKSQVRAIIHGTQIVQNKALDGLMSARELGADLDVLVQLSSNGHGSNATAKPVDIEEFLTMTLKPVSYVINPILPVQGLMLLYAWRGAGKTFFNLEIAVAVATGPGKCFPWAVPEPRPVLYVDGEMPSNELQDRLQKIMIGRGMKLPPRKNMLQLFTPDLVEGQVLNIVTRAGQKLIERYLEPGTLLILDNLSALGHAPGTSESESESWWPVQEWALSLRKKGITIIFIHHAGKKGEQRGTSAREDLMHTVIGMKKPADYSQHEGLRTEIVFEKIRRYEGAAGLFPFELKMESDDRGGIRWLERPLVEIVEARVKELHGMNMKVAEIAEECHLSRYQVYRIINRLPK